MRTTITATTTIVALLLAGLAQAQEGDAEPPPQQEPDSADDDSSGDDGRKLYGEVGAAGGLGISTAGFGVSPLVFIEGDVLYRLGPGSITGGLRIGFQTYSKTVEGNAPCPSPNPCIGSDAGAFSADVNEQMVFFGLPIGYRLFPPHEFITPYALIVPQLFLLKATSTAYDTDNTQTDTKMGIALALGGQLKLGPGGLMLELGWQYAGLSHSITGDSSLSAVTIDLGYRFLL